MDRTTNATLIIWNTCPYQSFWPDLDSNPHGEGLRDCGNTMLCMFCLTLVYCNKLFFMYTYKFIAIDYPPQQTLSTVVAEVSLFYLLFFSLSIIFHMSETPRTSYLFKVVGDSARYGEKPIYTRMFFPPKTLVSLGIEPIIPETSS